MTRRFEVPVIVNVTVDVTAGIATLVHATPDSDAAPWAFSGEPTAWEPDTAEGGTWHEDFNEDDPDPEAAWLAAYDELVVTIKNEGRKESGQANPTDQTKES